MASVSQQQPNCFFCVGNEFQSVAFALCLDGGNVFSVESAHEKGGSRFHAADVLVDIVQQDVAVDIGEYNIECAECGDLFGTAQGNLYIFRMVQPGIFQRVVVSPFVDVDSDYFIGVFHFFARMASTAVPHPISSRSFAFQVEFQHFADHQVSIVS